MLARPDRIERPTPWFEAKCSIQMSYGRNYLATPKETVLPKSAIRAVYCSASIRPATREISALDKLSQSKPDFAEKRKMINKAKRTAPREHLLPLAPKGAAIVKSLIARAGTLETTMLFSSAGKMAACRNHTRQARCRNRQDHEWRTVRPAQHPAHL